MIRLRRFVELFATEGALWAFITWPIFSLAAFSIISRMKRAGVNPATVVDVGANVGQFAVASTKLFDNAEIIPIEPDPRVADVLRRNLDPEVRGNVLVTAVGSNIGIANFNVNCDSQVSSLLQLGPDRIQSFPDSTVVETIAVPVSTLDVLFERRDLSFPILLKIDVQGFEDRVVAGAKWFLERVEWVLVEVSFSALYWEECNFETIVDMMKCSGFRFVRPMNFHVSPKTGEIIEVDALFNRISEVSESTINRKNEVVSK